jgi:hypothetical protein
MGQNSKKAQWCRDAARFLLELSRLPRYDPFHVALPRVATFTMFSTEPWRACRCSRNPRISPPSSVFWREALEQHPIRILAFVLMPNHWHFILWPQGDRDLSEFCRWLAHTHSVRWHAHYHTSGNGAVTNFSEA